METGFCQYRTDVLIKGDMTIVCPEETPLNSDQTEYDLDAYDYHLS
jgi:hypothetical protein